MSVVSDLYFRLGQCHTFVPQIAIENASKDSGYSVILKHDGIEDEIYPKEPGWHIYIHETKEHFAGKNIIFFLCKLRPINFLFQS